MVRDGLNPFTTRTRFWFEHNHPGEELQVSIRNYTISGKLVKTIQRTIFSHGNRSCDIDWDGRDEYGSRIGRGVYIYRLQANFTEKSSNPVRKIVYIVI